MNFSDFHIHRHLKSALRFAFFGILLNGFTALSLANGPIHPPEVRWVEGKLLVQVAEGIDYHRTMEKAGSVTPAIDELNQRFGVVAAELVMPQYRPTAMEAMRRSAKGRSMDESELKLMDGLGRWILLTADPTSDVKAMAEAYSKLGEVIAAEPNYIMDLVDAVPSGNEPSSTEVGRSAAGSSTKSRFIPNDPDFPSQWGLDYIDAPEAWDITMGDPSQVIAIIDTGVDLDHPDLVNKIWSNADEDPGDSNGDGCPGLCGIDDDGDGLIDEDRDGIQMGEPGWDSDYANDDDENGYIDDFKGWDWVSNGDGYEDNDPQDDNGHGTHCAGIGAAETNNGIGIAGACPLCTIMPLKAFQSSGTASFSDIAKAIDYARRNGATVINMSFGSYADSGLIRDALGPAFAYSTLVAAAGNDSLPRSRAPFYPAAYDFVVGVEAGTPTGSRSGFSNSGYELRNPGEGIKSTLLDDAYASWSGTSMAAPFVSGSAALLRQFRLGQPGWDSDLMFAQLLATGGNAHSQLTAVPEPVLQFIGYEIVDQVGSCPTCDGDGRPDSGESFDLVVTVRNTWGNAEGVSGTLSTSDPLATVLDGSATWGSVGPAAFDDNADNPFRIGIQNSAGNNRDIVFDLSIDPSNGGTGIALQIVLTVQRGLEKSGVIQTDETWTSDYLYLVTGNLLIDSGATVTIEPGTRVQTDPSVTIRVLGGLVAQGTPEDRIVLTSNGASGWGITLSVAAPPAFDAGGNYLSGSILRYCIIENMGTYNTFEMARVYLVDSILWDNKSTFVAGSSSIPIERNLFTRNTSSLSVGSEPRDVMKNTFVGNQGLVLHATFEPNDGPLDFYGCNIFENQGPSVAVSSSQTYVNIPNIHWGTSDTSIIDELVYDFFDNASFPLSDYNPFLVTPDPDAPPVVADITLTPAPPIGVERVVFTIEFSSTMNAAAFPEVFFGPSKPFTTHPVDLNPQWLNDTTFQAEVDIDRFTGDGIQTITVWNAEDTEGFPIPTGDHRFQFEIVTVGTSSASLQASGDIGKVDLSWFPATLPTLAGYNVYRADTSGGPYTKLNGPLVADVTYSDHTAEPGVVYHYIYREVNSELEESPDSDEASAAALDDVPPIIFHTPVTSAPAGLPVTVTAEITDNVATPTASLFHRELGSTDPWAEVVMINATGDQYTANVPVGSAVAPGVEYYLEASDGVSTVQDGTPASPHNITILDQPTVEAVTPVRGPLAGGTAVTINGTNFQAGCTVGIGGVPATTVVVVDPQTIACDTPAHYPAVADVTVTNPNTAAGTRTRAYTYDGSPTTIELPTTTHDRLSTTTLGISTPGVEGLISATLEFSYDPTVLSVQGAGTGSLTSGWTISTNTATPGTVRVSLAGTAPVTGLGTMAEVTVDVNGDPAAVTVLTWSLVELNEGVIPVTPVDGQVTVNNAFDVAGTVRYYVDARPVEGATMTLDGSASFSQPTGADGSFAIGNVPSDTYTLTPSKSDAVGVDDISALDASFVLQHDAGLMTLDSQQQIAGDVNASGSPTALDASYILQHSVGLIGLPFPGAGAVWAFDPQNRSYTPLDTDQTVQNFAGILIGDPTGNWNFGTKRGLDGGGALSFPRASTCGVSVQMDLDLLDLMPGTEVFSVDLTILYDSNVISVSDVSAGTLASGWSVAINDQTPGELRVAMAGTTPIISNGQLLSLAVTPSADGSSPLLLARAELNESRVTVTVTNGKVFNCALFEDGFESATTGSWE